MNNTIDHRLARRIIGLRSRANFAPHISVRPRTVPPGPALLRRFTLGSLVIESVRANIDPVSSRMDLVQAEWLRRGFMESADATRASIGSEMISEHFTDLLEEATSVRLSVTGVTDSILSSIGAAIDLCEPGANYMVTRTMLSPREQLEDLYAVGADESLIDAYTDAIEVTDISPSSQFNSTGSKVNMIDNSVNLGEIKTSYEEL